MIRNTFFALYYITCVAAASAQNLQVYQAPQEIQFPDGYDIVDGRGRVVKELPNERSANVQAFMDIGGARYYMSDWSYGRYRDQGIEPNWIRGRAAAANLQHAKVERRKSPGSGKIEGRNDEGERWAYEFLAVPTNAKISLHETSGDQVFGDSNWVVYAHEQTGNIGKLQTDIFFFDAKTLGLTAHLRVPNRLIYAGKIPGRDILYFLTITPGKYRYDDTSLALTLADPVAECLERVWLVKNAGSVDEDYWLSLQNSISLSAIGEVLYVDVPKKNLAGYDVQRENPVFKGIRIKLRALSSAENRRLMGDPTKENRELLVGNLLKHGSGLAYLGQGYAAKPDHLRMEYTDGIEFWLGWGESSGGGDPFDRTGLGLVGPGGGDLHVVRSSRDGSLLDVNLGTLHSSTHKLGDVRPRRPGIFQDGNLRCLSRESVLLQTKKGITELPLDESMESVSFSNSFVYLNSFVYFDPHSERKYADHQPSRLVRVYSSDGQPSDLSAKLDRGLQAALSESDSGFKVQGENNSAFAAASVADGFFDNRVVRFDLPSGEKVGGEIGVSTMNVSSGTLLRNMQFGIAPEGCDVLSAMHGWSTGGAEFGILLRDIRSGKFTYLEDVLPSQVHPLVVKKNTARGFRVFYALPGVASLVNYQPQVWETPPRAGLNPGGPIEDSFSNPPIKKAIHRWKYPPSQGFPLYSDKHGWVFIPEVFGYSVFDIGGGGGPQKRFDIHFQGATNFAVVLPDGSFAGSVGCEKLIRLPAGGSFIDASTLSPWRNRPAKVLKALGGDPAQVDVLAKVTERWLRKLGNPERKPEPDAADVPTLALINDVPLWARGEEVDLVLRAEPGSASVKDLVVRINGVDPQRGSNSVDGQEAVERTIRLAEGQNWIEAEAVDEKGRSSNLVRFRTILKQSPRPARSFIVTIGVSKYRDESLNLDYAAKDARDMARALKSISPLGSLVLTLTDEEVTGGALAHVREFLSRAAENDEVIVFCAGHGTLDANLDYLYCGHDFDQNNPSATGIKLDHLVDAIGASRSLKRLLLLDTCHSGQVGEKEEMQLAKMGNSLPGGVRVVRQRGMAVKQVAGLGTQGQQRFIEEMFLLPGLHRGINIIGASGGAEFALESDKWNNGVFTSVIIESLREKKADLNEDRRINVAELRNYLSQRVPELTGDLQRPSVVAFEQDQNFELRNVD